VLSGFGMKACEQTDSHMTHFRNFPFEGAKTFDKCRRISVAENCLMILVASAPSQLLVGQSNKEESDG
jgi:hypothetical protein